MQGKFALADNASFYDQFLSYTLCGEKFEKNDFQVYFYNPET